MLYTLGIIQDTETVQKINVWSQRGPVVPSSATKMVNNLVTKLPSDGAQKEPSSEVVVNICGILNNLVTSSSMAARDICFFDGLAKLVGIKSAHGNR